MAVPVLVIASDIKSNNDKKETEQLKEQKSKKQKQKKIFFQYEPPVGRSMPLHREGGGTRGKDGVSISLAALVPNHIALTTKKQPSLFWYQSEAVPVILEITINDEKSFTPILEATITGANKKGILRLDFSDYGLDLAQDTNYEWFVTLVYDPEKRSKDVLASGMIKYVRPSKLLTEKLSKAKGMEVPALYAESGFWYDAMLSISELIDADPEDKSLRDARLSLLEQVGLKVVED